MSELVIYLATPASFLRRFLPLSALIIIICIIVYLPSPMTVISGREYTLGEVTVTAGIILLILACALYFRKRVTEIFLYNAEKKITVKYTTGFSKSAQLDIPFEKLTVESRDRPSKNISKDLVVTISDGKTKFEISMVDDSLAEHNILSVYQYLRNASLQ
jgi:ABC-type transport system involved in cytochrome bd biosynthesis fused ATPase/permease subunit